MYFDKELEFSANQDLGAVADATEDSTNTIDALEGGDALQELYVHIKVSEAFAGGTSLAVNLVTDDDELFGSPKVIPLLGATPVAELTLDKEIVGQRVPLGLRRYTKLQYVVVGTNTDGRVSAGLCKNLQTWKDEQFGA